VIFAINCHGSQQNYPEEQIVRMLEFFYVNYITENTKMPPNITKIDSLKERCCTTRLLNKLKEDELDYDPFLKAQDSNTEWLKTLSIKKDLKESNHYQILYLDTYNNSQIKITVIVVKEKESYKIDSIF
jgi:hypothetical protein